MLRCLPPRRTRTCDVNGEAGAGWWRGENCTRRPGRTTPPSTGRTTGPDPPERAGGAGRRPLPVDLGPGAPPARVVGTAAVRAPRVGPVVPGLPPAVPPVTAVVVLPVIMRAERADRVRAERQAPTQQGPDGPEEQQMSSHGARDHPQQDQEPIHERVADQVPVEAPPDRAHRIGARLLGKWWRERREIPGQAIEPSTRLDLVRSGRGP